MTARTSTTPPTMRTTGAAHTVNYAPDGLRARIRAGQPDVVIDHIGGPLAEPPDPAGAARDRGKFTALWTPGCIRPVINSLCSLEQAREGLETVAHRRPVGKTIIQVA
ncbi:hypothetical protein [Rhodococcus pyridinivorans]|uniref:hypothetical protein n=1 Tax=Rhodococcus pyridinivorans TaxID=103816 RepID=UPI00110F1720|nr:hypothetical protein [Rhodococcus pyridinivorans]